MVLTASRPWPKGIGKAPELDQLNGGTTPEEFQAGKGALQALMDRSSPPTVLTPHRTPSSSRSAAGNGTTGATGTSTTTLPGSAFNSRDRGLTSVTTPVAKTEQKTEPLLKAWDVGTTKTERRKGPRSFYQDFVIFSRTDVVGTFEPVLVDLANREH